MSLFSPNQLTTTSTSGGTADANKLVTTGADGKLHPSFLPPVVTDVGFDLILLAGQSNCEGEGAGIDDYFDYEGGRILQYPPVGNYQNQIVVAKEPLIHQGYGVAGKIGFGLSFAKSYVKTIPSNRTVLLIPCALGGTGFQDNHWSPGNSLFASAVSQTNTLLALSPFNRLIAILWHQGENDVGMGHDGYQTALIAMINAMRSQINGATNTPFVLGELAPAFNNTDIYKAAITQAIKEIPSFLPYTWVTSGAGLITESDNIHYNAPSQRIFGGRYYQSLLSAQQNTLTAIPATPTNLVFSNITANSIQVSWTSSEFRWQLQYKASTDSSFTNVPLTGNTASITGLLASTSYQFQVRAVNIIGNSAWLTGNSATVATPVIVNSGLTPILSLTFANGTATDVSGNSNNGILNGATIIADPTFNNKGKVLSVVGNQYLQIPLSCPTSYTKCFRLYLINDSTVQGTYSNNNTANNYLFGDESSSLPAKWNSLFTNWTTSVSSPQNNPSGYIFMNLGNGNVTADILVDYPQLVLTLWQDIAVTYNDATKKIQSYYNGQPTGNKTESVNYPGGNGVLYVGHPTLPSSFYITDIKLFNYVLTDQQVLQVSQMAANT